MYNFSNISLERLSTCHSDLQLILYKLINFIDFSVVCGTRNEEDQTKAYNSGHSKVQYPNSRHNTNPSLAVDIIPYPTGWKKKENFYYIAGMVKAIAIENGIRIRWGGDWDGDNDFTDQRFNDLAHFELIKE